MHKRIEVTFITPQVAERWLKTSRGNRAISKTTVSAYARDMAAGLWRNNFQPIGFRADGSLGNGHHRLLAVVESGATIQSAVAYGLTDEDIDATDRLRARTIGDQLTINGEANGNALAALIRHLAMLAKQDFAVKMTVDEAKHILNAHPRLRDAVGACGHIPLVSPSMIGAVFYIGAYIQGLPAEADEFVDVFRSGIPAYDKCPAHLARERLLRTRTASISLKTAFKIQLVAYAWTLFAERRPVSQLKLPSSVVLSGWDENALVGIRTQVAA